MGGLVVRWYIHLGQSDDGKCESHIRAALAPPPSSSLLTPVLAHGLYARSFAHPPHPERKGEHPPRLLLASSPCYENPRVWPAPRDYRIRQSTGPYVPSPLAHRQRSSGRASVPPATEKRIPVLWLGLERGEQRGGVARTTRKQERELPETEPENHRRTKLEERQVRNQRKS
ncbi:hypothetical protein LZ31DRAFT_239107 [Colletotrichum somersetense]|nr:hypothetical protein LZ31DRAFT_239107 [Colletotrichum somersetense]